MIELAPVGDPEALAEAVATTLGIVVQAGMTVADRLCQALSGRDLLIVLDNCEHLLDAAADLVERVLARTSTVKVLATSRGAYGCRPSTCGPSHRWTWATGPRPRPWSSSWSVHRR